MKKYILFIFLFISCFLFAQDKIDSLENTLKTVSGIKKVKVLNELVKEYRNIEPAKGLEYGHIGLKIAKELKDKSDEAKITNEIGVSYRKLSIYDKALMYHQKALKIFEEIDDTMGIAFSYANIGNVYRELGDFNRALDFNLKSLKLKKILGDKNQIAYSLTSVGTIYKDTKQYDKALIYYNKALKIYRGINDKIHVADLLNLIGLVNVKSNNFNTALNYYLKSQKLYKNNKQDNNLAVISYNIAQFYSKQKYYDKAIVYLKKSIKISKKVGNKKLLMMCYEDLSELFYKKSEFRKAYESHLLFTKIKDNIFNKEKKRNITELEIKYKVKQKEKEIEVQKLIIDKKNTLLLIYLISGITTLIIVFIILFLYHLKRKSNKLLTENNLKITRQKDELAELNATKNKFFSIIAHDLKNPFNALLGFTNLLKDEYSELDDNDRKKYIEQINNSSKTVFNLLQNLLQWSRTQINTIDFKKEKIDLYNVTNKNIELLQTNAENKNIILQSNITPNTFVYADINMTTTIIRNLISNAIKFTKEGGKVIINYKVFNGFVQVNVKDTGVGINNENINKLFKIDSVYKTVGTQKEQGTGLGLIICKEFVEKNGGKIWVESKEDEGSTFMFTLPIN